MPFFGNPLCQCTFLLFVLSAEQQHYGLIFALAKLANLKHIVIS